MAQLEKCNDDLLKENYQIRCENMRLRKGQVVYKDDILTKLKEVERMLLDDSEEMKLEEPKQVPEAVVSNSRPLDTITRRKPRTEMVDKISVDECDTAMIDCDSECSSSQVMHDIIAEVDEAEEKEEDEVLAALENEQITLNEDYKDGNNDNENTSYSADDGMGVEDTSLVQEGNVDTELDSIQEQEEKEEATSISLSPTKRDDNTPVLSPAKGSSETPVSITPVVVGSADTMGVEPDREKTLQVEEAKSVKRNPRPRSKRSSSTLSPSKKPKKAPKRSSTRTALETKSINISPQKATPAPKQPSSSPPRRRSRGNQVNYALPSLRTKMRRQKDGLAAAIDG